MTGLLAPGDEEMHQTPSENSATAHVGWEEEEEEEDSYNLCCFSPQFRQGVRKGAILSFLTLRDEEMHQTPSENSATAHVGWEEEEEEEDSYNLCCFSPQFRQKKQKIEKVLGCQTGFKQKDYPCGTLTRFGARIYRDPCLNAFCVDTTFEKGKHLDVTIEWTEIGDLLWKTVIVGEKEGKIAQELGTVLGKVLRTLQIVSAEQAFEGAVQEKLDPPPSLRPKTAKFYGFGSHPIRGLRVSVSPTPQDVIDQVTQVENFSPPQSAQTESDPEVSRSPRSVGVEIGGDSGGAEGGDGQSQVTPSRGGPQGGAGGEDRVDVAVQAGPNCPQRAQTHSDPDVSDVIRRRTVSSDTAQSPSTAGGDTASRHLATIARTASPRSRSPEPSQRPLPSDSDSDSDTKKN
ncbi:hypothetical protein HGM15179_018451 [Zosterops borbonicus]|uniref:Uncharacterized protein n=1 Tax=Zosterops borbonicus TaxID=364589 RepID=A0A8K1LC49_9PASS|nr:hypothetical protein HGM15179_018451 [Zosterops borbonicus]